MTYVLFYGDEVKSHSAKLAWIKECATLFHDRWNDANTRFILPVRA